MKIIRVGVDLAKNEFQAHGVDRNEKPVWKRKLKRDEWIKALLDKTEPGCVIGMEACGGAHHWARVLQSNGYTVKLIAPQFVKPYVKSNKNDANDADVLLLAVHWLRMDDVLSQAGNLSGKMILSCSLPMNAENTDLVVAHTSSAAEELAKKVPKAHVELLKILKHSG